MDFHAVQRIVKYWASEGYVEEHCDKDKNAAKIKIDGVKYIESKNESVILDQNETTDILRIPEKYRKYRYANI